MSMMHQRSADLTILYGSQTGNAEDMAKRIGLQAKEHGIASIQVMALDDFQLKLLPKQKLILFVCATTGHGQEPENMKNFYNFIRRRELPCDCLKGLSYAVYGLGSSSYAKFNYVSKILFRRLKECGAEPLQDLVASDEQHQYGCDGLIYPKLDELWSKLLLEKLTIGIQQKPSARNSYSVKFFGPQEGAPEPCDKFSKEFIRKYEIKTAKCILNKQLTDTTHFQDTRHFRFQALTGQPLNYEPGDVCTIYPENSEENVKQFLQLLNLNPKQRFAVSKLDPNYMVDYLFDFIPDGLEIEDLVRYYLDVQSVPKRSFFEHLWPFCDEENKFVREKLQEFASTEGQAELYDYCTRPKRTILETMLDFPSATKNIKFEFLFDLIPPMKPRSFSIASALSAHPNEMHLLVGVVNYKTNMKKLRQGLCSNYLAKLSADKGIVRFFIRRTAFKLPSDHKVPIIMVGPGLGLSPFRSFIEEHALRKHEEIHSNYKSANSYLYFGCRFSGKDFYFQEELENYHTNRVIQLRVAFSREASKEYVQSLLARDCKLLSELVLEHNAIVYIAGNSKLPEELRWILGEMLAKATGGDLAEPEHKSLAERLVVNLEASNRIQYDCW